jgi:hypothetical protein
VASESRPLASFRSSTAIPVESRLQSHALLWDAPHTQTNHPADFGDFVVQRHSGVPTPNAYPGTAGANPSFHKPQQTNVSKFNALYASQVENQVRHPKIK